MSYKSICGKVTLFRPDDPLKPPRPAFAKPWHAECLALADSMVAAGRFSAVDWAEALGAALKKSQDAGAPDTEENYYLAVVSALEALADARAGISRASQARRKADWQTAYRGTPHGRPVKLAVAEAPAKMED